MIQRAEAIARIKKGLKMRSGKTWSVRGGRGTAWGWIFIKAPPARSDANGWMNMEDSIELTNLLGLNENLSRPIQVISIPDSEEYYHEYIDRAEGLEPIIIGHHYWD